MALFGSSRSTKTKLSCFGKLPSYGDFISLNNDSAAAQRLSRWLQEGVGALRTGLPGPTDQYHHFIWPVRGSRRTLVGVIWPSADAAGRRFPFTLFCEVPTSAMDKLGPQRVLAAEPIWRRIHEVFGRAQTLANANEQYKHMQDAKLPKLMEPEAVAAAHAERLAAPSLQHTSMTALAVHAYEAMQFSDRIAPAPPDTEYVIRSKLHGQHDGDIEACAWIAIHAARSGRREGGETLFVRVHPSGGEQSLIAFHRELAATDLGFLLAPAPEQNVADHQGFRDVPANQEEARFRNAFVHYWGSRPRACEPLIELGSRSWTDAELDAAPPAPPESGNGGLHPNEETGPTTGTAITGGIEGVLSMDDGAGEQVTGEVILPDSFPMPDPVPAAEPEPDTASIGEPTASPETVATPSNATTTAEPATDEAEVRVEDAEDDSSPTSAPTTAATAAPTLTPTDAEPDTGVTGTIPPAEAYDDLERLVVRLEELAAQPVLDGRLVALEGGDARHIYVDEGSGRPVADDELEEFQRRIDRFGEAGELLDRLHEGHAALEKRLAALVRKAANRGASSLAKPSPAEEPEA